MIKDEIVEQVRQVREQRAAKMNFDLKAILTDAHNRQKDSGHRVVSFATKPKTPVDLESPSSPICRGRPTQEVAILAWVWFRSPMSTHRPDEK